jgi:hypothetical protein
VIAIEIVVSLFQSLLLLLGQVGLFFIPRLSQEFDFLGSGIPQIPQDDQIISLGLSFRLKLFKQSDDSL